MTATAFNPSRTKGARRVLLFVVAFAVALAATIAIVLIGSSTSSSSPRPSSIPVEEELTETQKLCEMARVVGC